MFKKAARLREASAKPGPARPNLFTASRRASPLFWRAERTREYVSTTKARERRWRSFSTLPLYDHHSFSCPMMRNPGGRTVHQNERPH